jgi:hypothetical protein
VGFGDSRIEELEAAGFGNLKTSNKCGNDPKLHPCTAVNQTFEIQNYTDACGEMNIGLVIFVNRFSIRI